MYNFKLLNRLKGVANVKGQVGKEVNFAIKRCKHFVGLLLTGLTHTESETQLLDSVELFKTMIFPNISLVQPFPPTYFNIHKLQTTDPCVLNY